MAGGSGAGQSGQGMGQVVPVNFQAGGNPQSAAAAGGDQPFAEDAAKLNVASSFKRALGREPTDQELAQYVSQLRAGQTLGDVRNALSDAASQQPAQPPQQVAQPAPARLPVSQNQQQGYDNRFGPQGGANDAALADYISRYGAGAMGGDPEFMNYAANRLGNQQYQNAVNSYSADQIARQQWQAQQDRMSN